MKRVKYAVGMCLPERDVRIARQCCESFPEKIRLIRRTTGHWAVYTERLYSTRRKARVAAHAVSLPGYFTGVVPIEI
jgi:hypothetical protein